MTNAERRAARQAAAAKGQETRRRKQEQERHARATAAVAELGRILDAPAAPAPPVAAPPDLPRLDSTEAQLRRKADAEAKRLKNLRAVLATAREIRRESDLYHLAHTSRWHHSPKRWTSEQVDTARRFLQGFVRPDGTPQPHPIRRKGKWRL